MTGASGMQPCNVLEWNKIQWKRMTRWFDTRWWSVGMMEEHGWRNGHEKRLNENYGRDETAVWWVELFILHMLLLKDVQKTVVVTQIQYITVCDATASLPKFRVFRKCVSSAKCRKSKGWSLSLSWCIGSFSTIQHKKESLSPSVSFVKNQVACLVRIVLCELRLGRKKPDQCRLFCTTFFSPLNSCCNIFLHNISFFTKKKFPCERREVCTEYLTARTFFSVPCQSLSVWLFVVLSRRFSHAQHVRVAQGTSFFYDQRVLRASQQNILFPHIMSLLGSDSVYFLFDSTTIPDTFSTNADWNQIKPLCTPPRGWTVWPSGHTTSHHIPSESFVKNQISCLARIVLCERRLGREPRSMSSLLHNLLFSFTFLFFLWRLFWKFCFYSIFAFLLSIFQY